MLIQFSQYCITFLGPSNQALFTKRRRLSTTDATEGSEVNEDFRECKYDVKMQTV